jgi:hypothetical protein
LSEGRGAGALVDVVLHAAGVFPPMPQPINDALALLSSYELRSGKS